MNNINININIIKTYVSGVNIKTNIINNHAMECA